MQAREIQARENPLRGTHTPRPREHGVRRTSPGLPHMYVYAYIYIYIYVCVYTYIYIYI